jgi:uncharacterized membrane protein YagU involved in acid resistance
MQKVNDKMVTFTRISINALMSAAVFVATILVGLIAAFVGVFVRAQMPPTAELESDESNPPPSANKLQAFSPTLVLQTGKRILAPAFAKVR